MGITASAKLLLRQNRGQSALFACIQRDAPFHLFVLAYAFAGMMLGLALGVPHKFQPLSYIEVLAGSWLRVPALLLGGTAIWALKSPSPLKAWRAHLVHLFARPQMLAALLLFVSLSIFLGVFSSVKSMLPDLVPFYGDPFVADLDRWLHGKDVWRYTSAIVPPGMTMVLEGLYLGGWGLMLTGTMLAVLVAPRLRAVRTQYIWTFLLLWPVLGNVVAVGVMTAGPVYYDLVTCDLRFEPLLDYVLKNSLMQQEIQALLWTSHTHGQAGMGTGISAFPSLHVANATLFVLLACRVNRWAKWASIAFAATTLFTSVHLGWHYAVDGYFSIVATYLIWITVGRLLKKPGT